MSYCAQTCLQVFRLTQFKNVSSITAQAKQFPLKKPAGFHWDFFLLGCTSFIAGIIGIPLPNGLVPQVHIPLLPFLVTPTIRSQPLLGTRPHRRLHRLHRHAHCNPHLDLLHLPPDLRHQPENHHRETCRRATPLPLPHGPPNHRHDDTPAPDRPGHNPARSVCRCFLRRRRRKCAGEQSYG